MRAIKHILVAAVVVVILVPVGATAQTRTAQTRDEVTIKFGPDTITVAANVEANGLEISIAGGRGCVDFNESSEGKVRTIRLAELVPKGTRIPDGSYEIMAKVQPVSTFTLLDRTVGRGDREIEAHLKKGHKLAKTWDELPGGAPIVAQTVSNGFGVIRGQIVDRTVKEPPRKEEPPRK